MSKVLIDLGGYSWWACGGGFRRSIDYETLDKLVNAGAIFACDSREYSLRKLHLPWYKAHRPVMEAKEPKQILMRECAEQIQEEILRVYPEACLSRPGLEADDIVALFAEDGDTIMSQDKDMLTISKDVRLVDYKGVGWGVERLWKYTQLPLRRGNAFLAYQLMHGDAADDIPRLLMTKDRRTAPYVMRQPNPLLTACYLLRESAVRESLAALCLPTPLLIGADPIKFALETHLT